MKKILALALAGAVLLTSLAGCSRVKEISYSSSVKDNEIKAVSFNVAAPWGNLLDGTASGERVKRFAAYMNAVKPDIIGTQEMNSNWLDKLNDLMPDYDSYGVKRGGDDNDKKSEINTVFWRKDKFECVEQRTFWLSETPGEESRYEGAGCNRVCTYVMLHDIENDKYILHLNTHLDNKSDEARAFGAQVIVDELEKIRALNAICGYTVVLSGDFNEVLGDTATSIITSSGLKGENAGLTYHDWGNITDEDDAIDYIFTDGKIKGLTVLDDTTNGFVSDHYGICETIEY